MTPHLVLAPDEPVALLKKYGYGTGEPSAGKMITDAGFFWVTIDIAAVVDAVHHSGGVCLGCRYYPQKVARAQPQGDDEEGFADVHGCVLPLLLACCRDFLFGRGRCCSTPSSPAIVAQRGQPYTGQGYEDSHDFQRGEPLIC